MKHLRKNLILNTYKDTEFGVNYLYITLAYRTADGKIHQIVNSRAAL